MGDGQNATAAKRKRRVVCDNCRIRHTKCVWDGNSICKPCKTIGLDCCPPSAFRIRYDQRQRDLEALSDVSWVRTRHRVTFYDETPHIHAYYDGDAPAYPASDPEVGHPDEPVHISVEESVLVRPPFVSGPAENFETPSDLTSPGIIYNQSPYQQIQQAPKAFTESEAILIRNYVDKMAIWTDAHDPTRTFELELPRRALTEPILRHAICAFSARHMYRGTDAGETEAVVHQDLCLQLLIPAMSNSQSIDESTLMAVAILRQNEEMDEQDNRFHLEGVSRILNMVPSFAAAGGLGEAAAWLCLKEDIYVSLTTQLPINLNLEAFRESTSISRGDDASWASLMVLHLACLLKRVFSDNAKQEDMVQSEGEISEWNASKPLSYTPIHTVPRSSRINRPLPEYWMLAHHHAVGLQYFHIAQIVLHTMRPRFDPTPYQALRESRSRERSIRHHLLIVVGIATSNPRAENTWFTARHCLSVWGGCLHKWTDQQAVLTFLAQMSDRTGWRTDSLVESLRVQWEENTSDGE